MKGILRSLLLWLFFQGLKLAKGDLVKSLKIDAIKAYIKLVSALRQLGILWLACAVAVLISMTGFILLHLAAFLALHILGFDWVIALLCLVLGLAYVAAGAFFLRNVFSEKNWLDVSGSTDMIRDIRKDS